MQDGDEHWLGCWLGRHVSGTLLEPEATAAKTPAICGSGALRSLRFGGEALAVGAGVSMLYRRSGALLELSGVHHHHHYQTTGLEWQY